MGLSSTGTAHKTAFDTEADAYNTSASRVSKSKLQESYMSRDPNLPHFAVAEGRAIPCRPLLPSCVKFIHQDYLFSQIIRR
jgi:hypothetical protein